MKKLLMMTTLTALASFPLRAQEKLTVPFRDPSMPRQLVVDAMLGAIQVTGYNGQEVIVESTAGTEGPFRGPRGKQTPVPPGMKRIGGNNAGLDVTEENNTVRISTGLWSARSDVKVQVPVQTSVRVKTMTGQQVRIENVNGEIEVENMNGEVNVLNVSGSVVAHSANGKITVSLNNAAIDKPMSFSTMNGDIDVTLPAAMKANLVMKTENGGIFTDFDMQIDSTARAPKVVDNRPKGGRFSIRSDRATHATINGGGPEIQFTSFQGNILIHKK